MDIKGILSYIFKISTKIQTLNIFTSKSIIANTGYPTNMTRTIFITICNTKRNCKFITAEIISWTDKSHCVVIIHSILTILSLKAGTF